jgi:hypothetical protein
MNADDVVKNAAVAAQEDIDVFYEAHGDGHDTLIEDGHHYITAGRLICNTCKVYRTVSVLTESGPLSVLRRSEQGYQKKT